MKICLLALISLFMLSCEKDKTDSLQNSTSIIGKWSWVKSEGGIAYNIYTPASTGKIERVEFRSDSSYRYYSNDSLISQCQFSIKELKSSITQDSALMIIYSDSSVAQSYTINANDTLVLIDECTDGYTRRFFRIK